jgi:small GTP-binding protein
MEEVLKKVVLLGDSAVGKTSLMNRFVNDTFDDSYISTVGAKVSKKVVHVSLGEEEYAVALMVWDIIGSLGFQSTQSRHIAGSNGAVLVADLSRPETIKNLEEYWVPLLAKTTADVLPPILYVGNKLDIANPKVVEETMKIFSILDDKLRDEKTLDKYKILEPYVRTSAKTGHGVEEGFSTLALMMMMEHATFDPLTRQMDEIIADTIYTDDERLTAKAVLDMIISDLPYVVKSSESSRTILQDCFSRTDMDKDNPKPVEVRDTIDCLLRLALEKGANPGAVEEYRHKWLK